MDALKTEMKVQQILKGFTLDGVVFGKVFDLRPAAIIEALDLRRPIYRQIAALGHVGRTDIDLTWEHTDKVDELKAAAGIK